MKLVCVQEKALLSLSVCKTLALARHTIGFIGSCGRLGRRRAPRQTPAHRRGLHGRRGVRTQTAFAAPRRHMPALCLFYMFYIAGGVSVYVLLRGRFLSNYGLLHGV